MIRVVTARLTGYRSFWKFLGLQSGAIFLLAYVASRLSSFSVQGGELPIGAWFSPPMVWQTVCALARWVYFVPAFFTVQLVCAELELRLVRAQVIAGLEPRDSVVIWTLQNVLLTLAAVVATVLTVFALGAFGSGAGEWSLANVMRAELGFALYGFVFLNGAVLCAVLLGRPVPAITLLMLWPMIVEPAIGFALQHYGLENLRDLLPFATLGTLTSFPGGGAEISPMSLTTLLCAGYGVGAALLTGLRLSHADL